MKVRAWHIMFRASEWCVLRRFLRRVSSRQNPIRRKRAAIQISLRCFYFTAVPLGSDLVNNELPQSHLRTNLLLHSTYKHIGGRLPLTCGFPFGEWALRYLLIFFRLWHLFFLSLSVAGQRRCSHFDDGLPFVSIYAPLRLKCERKENLCIAEPGFQNNKCHRFLLWIAKESLCHLSWLSVSVLFFSGRRCRSTMWRQVSSTREITWTARCLTATATFWPASLWRSSLVRFLYLKALKHEPAASPSPSAQCCSFLGRPVFPEASAGFSLLVSPGRVDHRVRETSLTPAEIWMCGWNTALLPGKLATPYTVMASSSGTAAF